MSSPDKPKSPRDAALKVAQELCDVLKPVTDRLIVAGSLRRRKLMVGDVEILFVPKVSSVQTGLFETDRETVDHAAKELDRLLASGVIAKRRNVHGSEMWGAKNRLAVHVASGIPVDLFATTSPNWWNYLVCRTGNAKNNIVICNAAIARGWTWNPYGAGFTDAAGVIHPVASERDVFDMVGLSYLEPWERNLK